MLILDTEVYVNYFLLSFKDKATGRVLRLDFYEGHPFDAGKVLKIMAGNLTVSFNGNNFDIPLISAACAGFSYAKLKEISDDIIVNGLPGWQTYEKYDIPQRDWNHIDIMGVAPGSASLKIYGARLHTPTLQDLPITPSAIITAAQRKELRDYCDNDLTMTLALYVTLEPAIALREKMSEEYGVDLRSKSDAQIAETIIKFELTTLTKKKYYAPTLADDFEFKFKNPNIINFVNKALQKMCNKIGKEKFVLSGQGRVTLPEWMRKERITIGATEYQMGVGGLHSCETSQFIQPDYDEVLCDFDVTSYYPNIILQQNLAPTTLGAPFLEVYKNILNRRVEAKRSGDKVTAETLKIAVNGSFGKLGSKYSSLYAPELLIQTTVTGQLALLMLIERFEAVGARVVSANTDGIVVIFKTDIQHEVDAVAWDWSLDTSFALEKTFYRALASRDVNNYLAIKPDGSVKRKGIFNPSGLSKNPSCDIVYDAVASYLSVGIPVAKTIRECTDVRKFIVVRKVTGGATWRGEYLGRAIRFYISKKIPTDEHIHYSTNSNRVPMSGGARPLMELPKNFPSDVNYRAYVALADDVLVAVGAHAGKQNRMCFDEKSEKSRGVV